MTKSIIEKDLEILKNSAATIESICTKHGWGDPFAYHHLKELLMAEKFGHNVRTNNSGADAASYDGTEEYEYKSNSTKGAISATYNGLSVQNTWPEQERYLKEEKLGCYKHYIAKFVGIDITEAYMLDGKTVCDLLIPKIKAQWFKKIDGLKKKLDADPRLGVTLSKKELKKYGKRIV